MRVTAETRSATRQRILQVARQLFGTEGFDAGTTRDIARAAEIATGTLFNYFPSKEAVVACLAAEALEASYTEFERSLEGGGTFEEHLFALMAAGLRKLKPFRKYLPVVLETALSPTVDAGPGAGPRLRVAHLTAVSRLSARHGFEELSAVALQMYWSLYAGVLLFWATDKSPRQEDTLALLDHSVEMFVGWLRSQPGQTRVNKK